MLTDRIRVSATLILACVLFAGPFAIAQDVATIEETLTGQTPTPKAGQKVSELWTQFIHYVRIARADLARSFGQAILDSGAEPREIYYLAEGTAGSRSLLADRGAKLEGMGEIVASLLKQVELGYEQVRKDPNEIAAAIKQLGGTLRGAELAMRRLQVSGEFAMPQLIQALGDDKTPQNIKENIVVLLPRLGKEAVRPLSAATLTDDPALQEIVANALGDIGYPSAAPRLKDLAARTDQPRVKQAAQRALTAVAGRNALDKSVAELYYDLATKYYYDAESIQADPRYETANVWYWQDNLGLFYKPVPRPIFNEIYAMRMSRLALESDSNFHPAVSLWVASNLKRQSQLPAGAADQTYGEDQPSPEFYARASGAKYLQEVLARALKDDDTAVALGAISALGKVSGAKTLVKPVEGGAQPLVRALTYGDRQVRFLATESLAMALPTEGFTGCEIVPVVLNEALRQTGQRTALLVIADEQTRTKVKDMVRAAGYEVLESTDCKDAIAQAHSAVAVDVVVLAGNPDPIMCVNAIRQDTRLSGMAVLVTERTEKLRELADADKRMVLVDSDAEAQQVADGLAQAVVLGVGQPMAPEAAAAWAVRAAHAIERLADTQNCVFDIKATRPALVANLADSREAVKLAAGEALAVMNDATAQQALAEQAVNAEQAENVRVAYFNDLSRSVRRFGNQLTEKQASAVVEVVKAEGTPALKEAAAQALGALDLPSQMIQSVIVQAKDQ